MLLSSVPLLGSSQVRAGCPGGASAEAELPGQVDVQHGHGIETFVRGVWPAVQARVPGARLRIVGRRPGPRVVALGSAAGVEVVGDVPDVRPELWNATAAVVPLRIAQGLQNKVLEAMAAGLPVVTSSAAVRGIEAGEDASWIAAETPTEWADAIDGLIRDRVRADDLVERSSRLVRSRYSWDRKSEEYEAVLAAAVDASRATKNGTGESR